MRRRELLVAAGVSVLAGCSFSVNDEGVSVEVSGGDDSSSGNGGGGSGQPAQMDEAAMAVHEEVNRAREEEGVGTLRWNEDYADVAKDHSIDMADKDYFAHEAPNGQTFRPNRCSRWGENLYRSQGLTSSAESAEGAVDWWLTSSGHRRNLLAPGFDAEGIGVAVGEDGWVYVTQTLCGG